jgi:hypothetical protein
VLPGVRGLDHVVAQLCDGALVCDSCLSADYGLGQIHRLANGISRLLWRGLLCFTTSCTDDTTATAGRFGASR